MAGRFVANIASREGAQNASKESAHMCGYRDGYYWMAKERRESGEDKREFEELLKRDWLEFERRRK